MAVPVFVVGTLPIQIFSQDLRWLPAGGYVPLLHDPVKRLVLLAMPAARGNIVERGENILALPEGGQPSCGAGRSFISEPDMFPSAATAWI